MYNSQKINQDPNPYTLVNLDGNLIGRVSSKQPNGLVSCRFEPREEYDNEPNPILIAFREDTYAKGTVMEAKSIHRYWELYLEVLRGQGYKVTEDTKDHARKVLTKLVNVYGNKEEQ